MTLIVDVENTGRIQSAYSRRRQAGKSWQAGTSGRPGDSDTVGAKKIFRFVSITCGGGETYLNVYCGRLLDIMYWVSS